MARYEKGRKGETRKRIIELASQRFRTDGVDGVGVATLMADAGLTNGGFYAHFASKEDLVREAVVFALGETPAGTARWLKEGSADLPGFIAEYLSVGHRDHPERGCAMAALGPEMNRRPAVSRDAFKNECAATVDRIAAALPSSIEAAERTSRAFAIFAHMLGTLQMARLMSDEPLSTDILARGRQEALRLAGPALPDKPKRAARTPTISRSSRRPAAF